MKTLKKYILASITMLFFLQGWAQQDAQYTNFMYNQFVINPAVAGSDKVLTSAFFYRKQWLNFSDNPVTPTTMTFSSHMQIPDQNIGAGMYIVSDRLGFERRLDFNVAGSYFIDFRDVSYSGRTEKKLFMGMQFGFRQFSIDVSKLDPHEQGDQVIPALNETAIAPEVGLGFLYKLDNFYVGVSVPHLVQSRIKYVEYRGINARQVRHYYATTGYAYPLSSDITLKPNVLMKYAVNAPIEFDVNALVEYQKMVWAGLSMRTRDAMAFLVGINAGELSPSFNEQIKVGYGFDWTVSGIPQYNTGTHEIFLIYNIDLGEKQLLPKFGK